MQVITFLYAPINDPLETPQRFLSRKQRHSSYGEMGMAIEQKDLLGQILITNTSFMGPCSMGPVMVVYPDGAW